MRGDNDRQRRSAVDEEANGGQDELRAVMKAVERQFVAETTTSSVATGDGANADLQRAGSVGETTGTHAAQSHSADVVLGDRRRVPQDMYQCAGPGADARFSLHDDAQS